MEFIKKMKTREFIEMGLKTLAAICAALIATILMEAMIYNIQLNAFRNNTNGNGSSQTGENVVAYCIEESEDKYFVLYHVTNEEQFEMEWRAQPNNEKNLLTKAECEALKVKDVVFNAPSAFEFSITPIHYVVIAILIAGVGGYFAYRFIALSKEYKKLEETFKKTGAIEL